MSQLERVIKEYIKLDNQIAEADANEQRLQEKLQEELSYKHGDQCSVTAAEEIFNAHAAIQKHKSEVENFITKRDNAAETIKRHLELLDGAAIVYTYHLQDQRMSTRTYAFRLNEAGEVTHNHQKQG